MADRRSESPADSVLISRVIDAPRELVFKAWTDPEQLTRWYAPRGCSIDFRTLDVRPGGDFHSCILTPHGKECWCKGVYREIVEPERIVFSMEVSNEQGDSAEPSDVGMDPDWPKETIVTVTLDDIGARTKLTLQQTVAESLAKRTGAHPGWLDMLDRLNEILTA